MRVRMTKHITGYRDGEEWPEVGGDIDVPAHEAADLIANNYAQLAEDLAASDYVATTGELAEALAAVDLNTLTVAALKVLAGERGVDLGDATKKADIIAALELAQEEADATPPGDTGAAQAAGPDGAATGEEAGTAGEPADA